MLKAVVFDLDNTLYDYTNANAVAEPYMLEYAARKYSMEVEKFHQAWQEGKEITKELLPDTGAKHSRSLYFQHALEVLGINPIGDAWELGELFWQKFVENIQPYPGAVAMLERLKSQGIKTAICTDMTADVQHLKLTKLGLKPYLDALVASEENGMEKPHGRMFQLALDKLGAKPEESVMVGDSLPKDVRGGRSIGMAAMWKHPEECGLLEPGIYKFTSYEDNSFWQGLAELGFTIK